MKRPCNHPGCAALLDKSGYCERHKESAPKRHRLYDRHVRQLDPALAIAAKIRGSAKWRKVRMQILAASPLCADPHGDHTRQGITRTAEQVHHIQGLATRPDLWNDLSNLQPLCTACHARIEREHRKSDAPPHKPSSGDLKAFG